MLESAPPPEFEKLKRRSFHVSYGLGFVYLSMFTFVLPSMYHYLDQVNTTNPLFYGVCLSAFSLSRLVTSPFYGFLSDRFSVKPLVLGALVISAGGNLMYALGQSRYLILVARLLDGLAAGSMASVMSYLTRATSLAERTPTISNYWGVSMLAVIVSPAAGVAFSQLPPLASSWFANVTAPGFFMTLLCVVFVPVVAVLFTDLTRHPAYLQYLPTPTQPPQSVNPVRSVLSAPWTAQLCLVVYFVLTYQMAAYEMLVTPYVYFRFDWGILQSGLIITGVGVFLVVTNKLVALLSQRAVASERALILTGTTVCTAGVLFLFQYLGQGQQHTTTMLVLFFLGSIGVTIGFAISWPIVPALFSKLVGAHPHKGTLMGLLTAMASLSRIIAPLVSGTSGFLTNVTEAVMCGLGLLSVLLMLLMYRHVDVSAATPAGVRPLSKSATELAVPLRQAEAGEGENTKL